MKKGFLAIVALGVTLTLGAQEHLKSLNKEDISPEISPKTDFYHYVNKKWMDANPLTPEYSRYGKFNVLTDSSDNRIQRIVTTIGETNPEKGTVAYKIASIYSTGMDSVRRNAEGAKPIQGLLEKIENTPSDGMVDLFIWLHKNYSSPFYNVGFEEDMMNSSEYAMYFSGPGLGLGDRDYYLSKDKDKKKILDAYKTLIERQMQNAGYSKKDAKRIAATVIKIETAIADSTLTKEEKRNIAARINPRTAQQVKESYPSFPFERFFTETMGFEAPENFYVMDLSTTRQGDNLMKNLSDREKKDYYLWKIVGSASPYLSDKFTDAAFEFSKVMSGVEQMQPRWKRVQGVTESIMGEPIGELYVEEYFPESSKLYMIELVENLRNALAKHIMHLDWMSDDTKVEALKKLNSITVKIGYPDKWEDLSSMEINPELSYFDNVHNAQMWYQEDYLKKWGKPVDKTKWHMTPQTVNAYYSPISNEIVFPAGILQAPFFDPEASDAENYGGIGVVIGHELTHGFDDQGKQFDAKGNMINWWTDEDAQKFADKTHQLADQYSAVEVLPGLHANGEFTLGENIADQGGLNIAMTAFLDSQKKKGVDVTSEEALIEGFTPVQVFYMNYANLWGSNIREEEIRNRTVSDPHSLGINRVNVALRNLAPFFEAFGIQEGDVMYLPEENRVIIW